MRRVAVLATRATNMNGSSVNKVTVELMRSITTTAINAYTIRPRMSLIHNANSGISNTSPRKRLMASPGESGNAAAPGRLKMCVSRFLRSSVMVCTKNGILVLNRP